jgi:hypothetical protein
MRVLSKNIRVFFFLSLGFAGLIQARDLKMELPIANATANATWRGLIGPNFQFKYGDDPSVNGLESLVQFKKMESYARPYITRGRQQIQRDEASTCNDALRNLLTDAVELAKTSGGNTIIVHSTDFLNEKPSDAKRYFLCNSGITSSTVDAVVSIAKGTAIQAMTSAPSAQTLATNIAPQVPRALPLASGYADVYDIAKLPTSTDACKKNYADWLVKPNPKAFVIAGTTVCHYSWSTTPADKSLSTDPSERAMFNCNKATNGTANCKQYAIDGVVVWRP